MPTIDQGGNAFTSDMVIGTNDSFALNFRVNSATVGQFATSGNFYTNRIGFLQSGAGSPNSALITFTSTGTTISRNVADTNVVLIVNSQQGTSSIQVWQQASSVVSAITNNGYYVGSGIANIITSANSKIETNTTGAVISRNVADSNPALIVNQKHGSSSGDILTLQKNSTDQLNVSSSGVVKVANLSGTGTRMVTADSAGALSATTEVSSGSYTPTVSGPATYTPGGFRFTRIGDIVHGAGGIEITGCVVGTNKLTFDLPVSTIFSNYLNVTGTVSGINIGAPPSMSGTGNFVVAYSPTIGNPSMGEVDYEATDTNVVVFIEFTYIVQ